MHTQNIVFENDYVKDPLDGELRQVQSINGETLHMADGGVMGLEEVQEVFLPSEIECVKNI
jgi:hypothetical protein